MLAGTVHVNGKKNKNIYEVKPNQKEYVFIVPEKLEKKIKAGMVAQGSSKQMLYIKELLSQSDIEPTAEIIRCKKAKVDFLSEEELQARKKRAEEKKEIENKEKQEKQKERQKKQLAVQSVFKGHILVLKGKKFTKTPQTLKVRTNEKTYDLVKIGDIIHVRVRVANQEPIIQYVYVEEILAQVNSKPKSKDRKIHDHFYQKTPKGSYRKIRLDQDLNVINPQKSKKDTNSR